MRKLTIMAAAIAFGALLVPAQADDLHGAAPKNGNQCFKLSPGQRFGDARFGSWGACPQTASAAVAPATQRRTSRRSSSR